LPESQLVQTVARLRRVVTPDFSTYPTYPTN